MEIVADNLWHNKIIINLELKRSPTYFVLIMFVPNLCLFILSFTVFFVPFSGGEKVSTGLTVFLAIVVELIVVSEVLPPTGPDDMPLIAEVLVIYVSWIFLTAFAAMTLTALHSKHTELPRVCKIFLKSRPISFLCQQQLFLEDCDASEILRNFGIESNSIETELKTVAQR